MQAIILAGGRGTRLRPYTTVLPKPLVPVGDYPILEILIRQLAECGIKHVILTVGYHYELFQAFFKDGRKWGIQLEYSLEDKPLGTIGPLKLVKNLGDDFLIINGDTLTDLDYHELFQLHLREKNIMTIATSMRSVGIDYGVIRTEESRNIIGYTEKPEMQFLVAMGVNVLSKKILDVIPSGTRYDFPQLVLELIERKMPIRCYRHKGYWLDIGRPDDYRIAVEQFEKNRSKFLGNENNTDGYFVENSRENYAGEQSE
jgi:NDP-sugar pyrophosphorylase family protein